MNIWYSKPSLCCMCLAFVLLLPSVAISADFSLKIKVTSSKEHVLPAKRRTAAIDFVNSILNYQSTIQEFGILEVRDPFYPAKEPAEETPKVVTERVEVVAEPEQVAPEAVLKEAAGVLKSQIKGTLQAGSKIFLTTADGSFIGVGSEIPFSYKTQTHLLRVEAVSEKSFTLRLGSLKRRVSILDTTP